MSLKSQLAVLRAQVGRDLPPGAFDRLQTEVAVVRTSGMLKAALKAGDCVPDFRLQDGRGATVRLSDLFDAGPAVVCFYRGDWCRFCSLELLALAEVADEIRALGASLIAIAPQAADARRLTWPDPPPFALLVDAGAKVAKSFGLVFLPAEDLRDDYAALGRPEIAGCHTALPVPATYIVDPSGSIVFSYFDSDFMNRLEPTEILVALRRLRESARPRIDP
jgi:peroxiredoxin